ncbi:NAD(P)/FAD-dependent oxidoreductase [Synechococcus sp. HK05]|uniref:NAD(P)/FAD-dependent oxidoreductase n=1 Tax=Synechococcus sp. HK05 TaxID=2725975 RepID=UPI001C3826F9|nr:NAD(P)/FAD-dependent oxidoreductase [Synechococcus sp. HK05]MBV2351846.1 NAD(P)/FAD-dependent oxidoreductase [Synechococcus sp. HK05]
MAPERFFLELTPPSELLRDAPHVVIVGAGFAGLKAAQTFAGKTIRVTLIDKRNFNLFQPMLYQVASGLVSQTDVASPLRIMIGKAPNVQILMGEVVDIDAEAKEVVFNDRRLRYDHLIVATGATSSFFGHDEWAQFATPMKSLEDAYGIRKRVLGALEEAEQTPDLDRRRLLQSVVVVGGGPTGCELAASLNDLMRHTLERDFKQIEPGHCKVTLVDPGDRVLRAMDPQLSKAAGDHLSRCGVELLLGGRVKAIEESKLVVTTAQGEVTLEASTICWTAGVAASPLGKLLADRTGCSTDRGGRIPVQPDFSIPGHPEIRVVGDLCSYSHTKDGKPLPGMAGPAVQMGVWVAKDILAQQQNQRHSAFAFTDFGTMAIVGSLFAVADLRGVKVSGVFGWLLWGLAHLAFMPDRENRVTLLTKWLWLIFTRERSALVITEAPS